MKTPSKRTERHGQLRALTIQHLQSLTSEDLKQLTRFAERRMGAFPRAGSTAEDAVQKAIAAIVRGTEKSDEGRRPRSVDLKSKSTFMHFARSAINSVIEALNRKRELLFIHESVHNSGEMYEAHRTVILAAPPTAESDVNMIDLKRELFIRLRQEAPKRLTALIDEWEASFLWESKLPIHHNRRHRQQLQQLASKVLKEIAGDLAG